ncbi:Gag-Pol polyprotein [Gossypium australe]|uniref:Gag-Pol polyprotein n=1 Tax=Gossypium australe TaxID=47621 RepID=A0A5B6WHQ3_9ROSI|nr:Gag-Pol polyprotein [Gossypium australe]
MDPNQAVADDVETAQQPLPPPNPQPVLIAPQGVELLQLNKPPVDKIKKYEVEEFRATVDDDPKRAEFWLENTIIVFDELSCTPAECVKGVVSLLRDTMYQWWNTLISMVPRERVTWEFFQAGFRKKYISRRFIDQKRKEFQELKQGRMSVTEYEKEFVRLSKYARKCVSTKAIMCKRFKDGLNEDIRLSVGFLELKEFVVLVDRACKAKELGKEKRKVDFKARDLRKRSMSKPYPSYSKKSRGSYNRPNASVGYTNGDRGKQYSSPKAQATSVSSVDHFIRDCPELPEKDRYQNARSSNTTARGRPPRNTGNVSSSKGTTKDSTVRSEARKPTRTYAIRSCEDPPSPDVITACDDTRVEWDKVTMDFVSGLLLSPKKKDTIWVIIDQLTKLTHFIPVRTNYSLDKLADLYISEIIRLHRRSEVYVKILEEIARSFRYVYCFSSANYSQSERVIQILKDMFLEFAPYEALYGRKCRTSLYWTELSDKKIHGVDLIRETNDNMKVIHDSLKEASDRQKSYADLKSKDIEFQIDDRVFLKVSPWKKILHFGRKGKLSLRFIGPYEINERIGPVAYRLALSSELE